MRSLEVALLAGKETFGRQAFIQSVSLFMGCNKGSGSSMLIVYAAREIGLMSKPRRIGPVVKGRHMWQGNMNNEKTEMTVALSLR